MPKHDAVALLKADHAAVKKPFDQNDKATKHDAEKKQEIFNQIKAALHSPRRHRRRNLLRSS
jgi:hypothetical protein